MSEATDVLWPPSAAWPEYNDARDTGRERAVLAALTPDEARDLAERSCVYAGTVHVEVDLSGRSVWHEASDRSQHVNPPSFGASLRLGEQRPRPFTGLAFGPWDHPSQLGGFPHWVQNPTFPACPRCGNRMPFLAQLGLNDLEAPADGTIYVFYSPECGRAASLHQQT